MDMRRPDLWIELTSWDPNDGAVDDHDLFGVWDTVVDFIENPAPDCLSCGAPTPQTKRDLEILFCSKECQWTAQNVQNKWRKLPSVKSHEPVDNRGAGLLLARYKDV